MLKAGYNPCAIFACCRQGDVYIIDNSMKMNNHKGVTLVEMLIVISVIAILVVALGFSFVGWMGKYKVESQAKDIYTDLMNARARAMNRGRMHFVYFPDTTSYEVYEDDFSSAAGAKFIEGDGILQPGAGANADTRQPTFPKTLEYAVTIGTVAPPREFGFNNRGRMASVERTICVFSDYDGDGTSDYDPDYDCIVVSETRIGLGKIANQGDDCDSDNCSLK